MVTGCKEEDQTPGYIFPEGKVMPNTIFVGGIDVQIDAEEIKENFSSFGSIKDVKIIADRSGVSKGYGFVSFYDDIDVEKIVNTHITLHGKRLKLGPAIRKHSTYAHHIQPRSVVFNHSPPQFQNTWNVPSNEVYLQPTPVFSPVTPCMQTCPYQSSPVMQYPLGFQHPSYYPVSPQWAGGEPTNFVLPQAIPYNTEMLPAEYTIQDQHACSIPSPQKKVDRSIQTVMTCLYPGDGRIQNTFMHDGFMKERRVHHFKRRSMFRPIPENAGI
ncbi:deleted in azoospermia-like isoform X2 [Hyperolius riggenbachi]